MNLILLVPRVIQSYLARFPEVRNNAYHYFNYDNRVVDESVDRQDKPSTYKDADDFTDVDYGDLVSFAQTLVNPILMKYSQRVAFDDALSSAIRSFSNGAFDGKVNAGRYNVLLDSMGQPRMAKKKKEEEPKPKQVKPNILRQLGLGQKDVTKIRRIPEMKTQQRGTPNLMYKEKGKIFLKDKKNKTK